MRKLSTALLTLSLALSATSAHAAARTLSLDDMGEGWSEEARAPRHACSDFAKQIKGAKRVGFAHETDGQVVVTAAEMKDAATATKTFDAVVKQLKGKCATYTYEFNGKVIVRNAALAWTPTTKPDAIAPMRSNLDWNGVEFGAMTIVYRKGKTVGVFTATLNAQDRSKELFAKLI